MGSRASIYGHGADSGMWKRGYRNGGMYTVRGDRGMVMAVSEEKVEMVVLPSASRPVIYPEPQNMQGERDSCRDGRRKKRQLLMWRWPRRWGATASAASRKDSESRCNTPAGLCFRDEGRYERAGEA